MKKFFVIALAAMSLSMVSCKSAEEKKCIEYVEQISKCMESEDTAGAIKACDEMQEWMQSLNGEQQESLKKALGPDGEAQMQTLVEMVELMKSLQ